MLTLEIDRDHEVILMGPYSEATPQPTAIEVGADDGRGMGNSE